MTHPNYPICLRCGNYGAIHCMINGNDFNFCSENCIKEYSKTKGIPVTVIDIDLIKDTTPEKVIFT